MRARRGASTSHGNSRGRWDIHNCGCPLRQGAGVTSSATGVTPALGRRQRSRQQTANTRTRVVGAFDLFATHETGAMRATELKVGLRFQLSVQSRNGCPHVGRDDSLEEGTTVEGTVASEESKGDTLPKVLLQWEATQRPMRYIRVTSSARLRMRLV